MALDLSKSLQELEGKDWGEAKYDSHLVTTIHRLRRVPLSEFSVEDLRIVIGQNISLSYLVPIAIDRVRDNELVAGDFYRGDLLVSLLRADAAFWREHPKWRADLLNTAKSTVAGLRSLGHKKQGTLRITLDALGEACDAFELAMSANGRHDPADS
jgi:hypothetical protein